MLDGLVNAVSSVTTPLYCDFVASFANSPFYAPSATGIPFIDNYIINPLKNGTKSGHEVLKYFAGFLAVIAIIYLVWLLYAKFVLKDSHGREITTFRLVAVLLAFLFFTAIGTDGFAFIQNLSAGGKDSFSALMK